MGEIITKSLDELKGGYKIKVFDLFKEIDSMIEGCRCLNCQEYKEYVGWIINKTDCRLCRDGWIMADEVTTLNLLKAIIRQKYVNKEHLTVL